MAVYNYILPKESPNLNKIPQPGSKKLGKFIWDLFLLALHDKLDLGLDNIWDRNNRLYRGELWDEHFKSEISPDLVVANLIFPFVERRKSLLTDKEPKPDIIAHKEDMNQWAKDFSTALNVWWRQTDQQKNLMGGIHRLMVYGPMWTKAAINPELMNGLGDVEIEYLDPYEVFCPRGYIKVTKMPWIEHVRAMDIDLIERIWPESEGKVKVDDNITDVFNQTRRYVTPGGSKTTADSGGKMPSDYRWLSRRSGGSGVGESPYRQAIVVECWIKDYTRETILEEDPETGEIKEYTQPKYPGNIRRVIVTNEGNLVLDDRGNPSINPDLPREQTVNTDLYERFPFEVEQANDDALDPWGISSITQLESLVRAVNDNISMINTYGKHSARPPMIVSKDTGITRSQVLAAAKHRQMVLAPVSHIHAQGIQFRQPASLPSEFFNTVKMLQQLFQIVSGQFDVDQGQQPGGVTAATAIMALQEKAEILIRSQIRAVDNIITFLGRAWLGLMQNWGSVARTFVSRREDGQVQRTELAGVEGIGQYQLNVVPGSTMPQSEAVRRQEAIQLAQMGMLDQQAVLEAVNFPQAQEVIERTKKGIGGQIMDQAIKNWLMTGMIQNPQQGAQLAQVALTDPKEIEKMAKQRQQQQGVTG